MCQINSFPLIVASGSSSMEMDLSEDGILYITTKGGIDGCIASKAKEIIEDVLRAQNNHLNIIVDLNKIGQDSPEAKKIWREMGDDSHNSGKIALTGLHVVAQLFATFLMGRYRKKKMRFFKDKAEALKWITLK